MGRVQGKVAIVTGGRKGLGRASAILLAKEGAKVVITDLKAEGAEDVLEHIRQDGGEAIFVQQDVSKEEDWQRMMEEAVGHFGKPDVLVSVRPETVYFSN
jgi:3(or 17)beta-hydroxysteroid dehydrogenase